ncbi:hypothetical protein AB1Y20_015422 [Prymnesium parvum]|uniref:AB hydrolase-1 domain-containing protein n=1 Tax=Prymnesium parvum TaxID=97485 RepID=A0AB34JXS9_PRYPA|mmetsp:Transcript_39358/g.90413  ORF Transcript_39358/g.90413 Transcript_39358/m.90413 type:complete len:224 (-) Transcript_39358:150-821(-)
MVVCAYLHGFLSSHASSKGKYLAQQLDRRFATQLHLLDLNGGGDPSRLSHDGALSAVDGFCRSHAKAAPICLIGSSFGGWAAAAYASLHPERVDRLLLLCPAFGLADRWEAIVGGSEQLKAWETSGSRTFVVPASGQKVSIPWAFAARCADFPTMPPAGCVTTIVHGKHDSVIPWQSSQAFVEKDPGRRKLVLLDDDHALTLPSSLAAVLDETAACFGLRDTE